MLTARRAVLVLSLAWLTLWPATLHGQVARLCDVSYFTETGWSKDIRAEVTFMNGIELFKAVKNPNFRQTGNYALIWFSKDEVAILEHQGMAFVPLSGFDNGAFRQMFSLSIPAEFVQVNIPVPRRWRIKARDTIGQFIDPRANASPAVQNPASQIPSIPAVSLPPSRVVECPIHGKTSPYFTGRTTTSGGVFLNEYKCAYGGGHTFWQRPPTL